MSSINNSSNNILSAREKELINIFYSPIYKKPKNIFPNNYYLNQFKYLFKQYTSQKNKNPIINYNQINNNETFHELNNIYLKSYKKLKNYFDNQLNEKGLKLEGNKKLENLPFREFNNFFQEYGNNIELKLQNQILNYFYPNDNNPKLMGNNMQLTPIPIKKNQFIYNKKEKEDTVKAERSAVIMRRLEYTHGVGEENKKNFLYILKGAILIIEDWWIKTNFDKFGKIVGSKTYNMNKKFNSTIKNRNNNENDFADIWLTKEMNKKKNNISSRNIRRNRNNSCIDVSINKNNTTRKNMKFKMNLIPLRSKDKIYKNTKNISISNNKLDSTRLTYSQNANYYNNFYISTEDFNRIYNYNIISNQRDTIVSQNEKQKTINQNINANRINKNITKSKNKNTSCKQVNKLKNKSVIFKSTITNKNNYKLTCIKSVSKRKNNILTSSNTKKITKSNSTTMESNIKDKKIMNTINTTNPNKKVNNKNKFISISTKKQNSKINNFLIPNNNKNSNKKISKTNIKTNQVNSSKITKNVSAIIGYKISENSASIANNKHLFDLINEAFKYNNPTKNLLLNSKQNHITLFDKKKLINLDNNTKRDISTPTGINKSYNIFKQNYSNDKLNSLNNKEDEKFFIETKFDVDLDEVMNKYKAFFKIIKNNNLEESVNTSLEGTVDDIILRNLKKRKSHDDKKKKKINTIFNEAKLHNSEKKNFEIKKNKTDMHSSRKFRVDFKNLFDSVKRTPREMKDFKESKEKLRDEN